MKPLNQKERSRTYVIFAVLFLIGIGLVSIPFFSLYKLMEKNNKLVIQERQETEKEIDQIQANEKFLQEYFVLKMDDIKELINKLESADEDTDVLNAQIGTLVSEVKRKAVTDSTGWRSHMYNSILDTYLDLKEARNKKMDATTNSEEQIDEKDQQIKDLKSSIRDCKEDLRDCEEDLEEARKPKINPIKPTGDGGIQ